MCPVSRTQLDTARVSDFVENVRVASVSGMRIHLGLGFWKCVTPDNSYVLVIAIGKLMKYDGRADMTRHDKTRK